MTNAAHVPALPHGCGSWIVVRIGTLEAVAEFYNRATVERINTARYTVLTAVDYLQRFNVSFKAA